MSQIANHERAFGPETLRAASREFGDLFDRLFEPPRGLPRSATGGWMPAATVWEDDQHLHVEMDLPGASAESFDVTVDDQHLTIKASRTISDEGRKVLYQERRGGEMTRVIKLPDTIDRDSVDADYNDGVLHVRVGKRPEVLPRKIEVRKMASGS